MLNYIIQLKEFKKKNISKKNISKICNDGYATEAGGKTSIWLIFIKETFFKFHLKSKYVK